MKLASLTIFLCLVVTPGHAAQIGKIDASLAGDVDVTLPLQEEARDAAIVALVHIASRKPVLLRAESFQTWRPVVGGNGDSCGYLYHAVVVESLKGGSEPFDFFSSVNTDFTGYDHDYLVVAFKRDGAIQPLNLDDLRYVLNREEGARLNCLLSQNLLHSNALSIDVRVRRGCGDPIWRRLASRTATAVSGLGVSFPHALARTNKGRLLYGRKLARISQNVATEYR